MPFLLLTGTPVVGVRADLNQYNFLLITPAKTLFLNDMGPQVLSRHKFEGHCLSRSYSKRLLLNRVLKPTAWGAGGSGEGMPRSAKVWLGFLNMRLRMVLSL